jgi:phosphohistidine phosphatase SixA
MLGKETGMTRLALALIALLIASPLEATEAGWALLRDGGHIVLLTHAFSTPGAEPGNFDIKNCATQRNLSERGRQQARKMGALFAARAAETERVASSRYCRCLDTAELVFRDEAEPLAALDLLSSDEAAAAAQTAAVMEEIRNFSGSGNFVLVTHPANIHALTGATPREGEAIIVRPEGEGLHVLGRIVFN